MGLCTNIFTDQKPIQNYHESFSDKTLQMVQASSKYRSYFHIFFHTYFNRWFKDMPRLFTTLRKNPAFYGIHHNFGDSQDAALCSSGRTQLAELPF